MKHTKEKWNKMNASQMGVPFIIECNDETLAHVYGENAEANAKLIAAAPLTYKWCMNRLDKMQKMINSGIPLCSSVIPEYKELLAIKKATS